MNPPSGARAPALPEHELTRLRTLLVSHGIDDDAESILREARPAISLFLSEIVERDERSTEADFPAGTHRFGGRPDLPAGMRWPAEDGEPLPFVLQLSLASLPQTPGSPLPARGMLWLFQGSLELESGSNARMLWKDCTPSECVRQHPPAGDLTHYREYEPFGIEAVAATDFPPTDSHDNRPRPHGDLPVGYFDFVTRARDPHFDQRVASDYPWHWHYVGQLLGVTSKNLQRRGRSHWQRLLSLNENPITDFSTPVDAAPLHYMVDAREKPWTRLDSLFVASAM